jgi:DNA-binding CsgD family transcriptional regulator
LSENTIKTYTRTLYGKVGVSSREELYALLIK